MCTCHFGCKNTGNRYQHEIPRNVQTIYIFSFMIIVIYLIKKCHVLHLIVQIVAARVYEYFIFILLTRNKIDLKMS